MILDLLAILVIALATFILVPLGILLWIHAYDFWSDE